MTSNQLEQFSPCEDSLLQLAITKVDSSMLMEIARADYGFDEQKHYSALAGIYRGIIPGPTGWYPQEVLQLTRWSEPGTCSKSNPKAHARDHWMRLFACTVLMKIEATPEAAGYVLGEDSNVIQLTESALELGPTVVDKAISFLAWFVLEDETHPCRFAATAILLLAIHSRLKNDDAFRWLISVIRGDHEEVDGWDEWEIDPKRLFHGCQLKPEATDKTNSARPQSTRQRCAKHRHNPVRC